MFNFNFFMPTKVIHGKDCVKNLAASELQEFGKKALIVCGKSSAKLSGALDDVLKVFQEEKIEYSIYDDVENNPSLENVTDGGRFARRLKPDFIMAIGGGSPLDAAKAIAVLAKNEIQAKDLYDGEFDEDPLPIVAIPTTAGTGSEVTPYSVLTIKEKETKQGFKSPKLFPKFAFLDYRYTTSLPTGITLNTAVDALSHLIEGYLTKRANLASDIFAEQGIRIWGKCIQNLRSENFTNDIRDNLLIASALGGITISHTGTTFVHSLGYSLTYYYDIPHGQANGLLMGEYLRYNASVAKERVNNILTWLGLTSVEEFCQLMNDLLPAELQLDDSAIEEYAAKASDTKNAANSLGNVTKDILANVLTKSLT